MLFPTKKKTKFKRKGTGVFSEQQMNIYAASNSAEAEEEYNPKGKPTFDRKPLGRAYS